MSASGRSFSSLYFDALNLKLSESAAATDENLSIDYPLCLYRFSDGRRLISLCPELEEALCALKDVPQNAEFSELFSSLFEDCVSFRAETVSGFFLKALSFEESDIRIRPLKRGDGKALAALHKGCGREWRAASIKIGDLASLGLFDEQGALLAAASAQPFGAFGDIAVFTNPQHRGRGLGTLCVSALCTRLLDMGLVPLYRAENENIASIRLARSLGFELGFSMTGACVQWPDS